VLTPTHLHEFKSADKSQLPIMSLFLPEQKLGSHSQPGASSNKFMLKGRQAGSLHRGHSWVFRAESYDTMMAWFEDIKTLTEKSPQERSAFVRQHARSVSGTSQKAGSISSDGAVDEEDDEPFVAPPAVVAQGGSRQDVLATRPKPGGRFPSDLMVNAQRGLQVPLSPSSGSSGPADVDTADRDVVAAAADLPGSGVGQHYPEYAAGAGDQSHASELNHFAQEDGRNPYTAQPLHNSEPAAGSTVLGGGLVGAAAEKHRDAAASAAPEVYDPSQEAQLAAHEASTIAAPDVGLLSTRDYAADNDHIAGGLGQGGPISAASTDISLAPTEPSVVDMPPPTRPNTLGEVIRAGQHHESTTTISQLHVPGGFPK
jgi:hypothetical protein